MHAHLDIWLGGLSMKILLISNMYPSGGNFSGIFIKHQIESIEKLGVQVTKVVKRKKTHWDIFLLSFTPFIS